MSPRGPIRSTRAIPTADQLAWRAKFLQQLETLVPDLPHEASPVGLAPGNKKTGKSGSLFRTVFVWNLPAVATCPGASAWCRQCCYNADDRIDVFPVDEWGQNWSWFVHDREALRSKILSQLSAADPPVALRLHSSGDFFSIEYVRFWIDIARTANQTRFWAYTRSWQIHQLRASLEEFRAEPNVQLFASWDSTMPSPPSGWRRSVVFDRPDAESGLPPLVCPEQTGAIPNCASCGYCIEPRKGDVTFILH